MIVADYYTQGRRAFFRLHEKGGRYHVVPAHHVAITYVDDYLAAASLAGDKKGPLFRSSGQGRRQNTLVRRAMTRHTALKMIKRRALEAGLPSEISNHSLRGTSITAYLRNGGNLGTAARIAGHESTRTTQLYNRVHEKLSLDEIERHLSNNTFDSDLNGRAFWRKAHVEAERVSASAPLVLEVHVRLVENSASAKGHDVKRGRRRCRSPDGSNTLWEP